MLNLIGSVVGGFLAFALVVIATRSLGPAGAGSFFEGVAFLSIASTVLLLGADVGLVRSIGSRSEGHRADARATLTSALTPTFLLGIIAAGVAYVMTPALAGLLDKAGSGEALVPFLHVFVLALPFSVVYLACIAASRGFGTMMPAVTIDKIARPLLQVILLTVVVLLGWGAVALAASWTIPIVIGLVAVLAWLLSAASAEPGETAAPRRADRAIFVAFWRFSLPRGIAATFQVMIVWLDTLLIGILASTRAAGIYTASTRLVLLGGFVSVAIAQAVTPQFASMFTSGQRDRARALFSTATTWGIAATWPLYLTLALYAPTLLFIFGARYREGAGAVTILALSMLVASATGPVDWVLLMGGKSGWNLVNTAAALTTNVALNLILIPRLGINGAAIAWSASIIVNNVAPLVEVWLGLGVMPFSRGYLVACGASAICFGGMAWVIRALVGQRLLAMVLSITIATAVYLVILYRVRELLDVGEIIDAVRSRRRTLVAVTDLLDPRRHRARTSG